MFKLIGTMAVFLIGSIVGLSFYLQPDDIHACDDLPDLSVECSSVDAIVVVSGGDTEARTLEAVNLYKKGWATKLIFSGAAEDKSGPSNAAAMKSIAINTGVSESAILLDEYSINTKENAENVSAILTENNFSTIILVTSGYHQKRASLEFNKNSNVTIFNHPASNDSDWNNFWFVTPMGWTLAISELIKIGIFYVTGIF